MPRDLPSKSTPRQISTDAPSKTPPAERKSTHLSLISGDESGTGRLTRSQVADRLGVSISTVRRFEGQELRPTIDEHDVRWFEPAEVTALAARIANKRGDRGSRMVGEVTGAPKRTAGELAALAFERFQQRQSLAEIVIGLRVTPEIVRELFEQWSLGLVEGVLRAANDPSTPQVRDLARTTGETLERLLAELPSNELTRISVARYRGEFVIGDKDFADLVELGGFTTGPTNLAALVQRFGPGDLRVTAVSAAGGLRWEFIAIGLV